MYKHRSQTLVVHAHPAHPDVDPALLAFIKCHITSFTAWDVLRAMSEQTGFWVEPADLARATNRPIEKVKLAMNELTRQGIIDVAGPSDDEVFRLSDGEPTTVVVHRLITRATRSQDLRRIVVNHILQSAVA